jgi:Mn-dependent DtxR family transcriptional regulator
MARVSRAAKNFTPKQGQYLAFIYAYTRLHRRPPAEADMQQYFRVSPPSVHQMVITLERSGFIRRQPGVARSIEMLVDPQYLPVLREHPDQPVKITVQRY